MDELIVKPGSVLDNRYEIVRLLHRGRKSFIYEAVQCNLALPVIIKVLRELYQDPLQAKQQVEQSRAEARLFAQLDHPSLVRVFDVFEHRGYPVIAMERVNGRSLKEISELAPKPIGERRVLAWAELLLESLEYLHAQHPPVIVRDLQPSNVLLGSDGRLRLVDFGLAKQMDEKGRGTQEITMGIGEDGFAPLEQRAYSSTDARSDLYSLAATLYFMMTKECPPAPTARLLAKEDPLKDPRTINSTISDHTWSVLQEMLAHRPEERPASASKVKELLGLGQPEPEPEQPAQKGVRRCVDCSTELVPIIKQGVELDQCEKCHGLWLDHGELAKLVEVAVNEAMSVELHERRTLPLDVSKIVPLDEPEADPEAEPDPETGKREKIRQLFKELFSLK